MVTKAAPRLAPAYTAWLEYELRSLASTRQLLVDADSGRLDRFGPTYVAEFTRLRAMRQLVDVVDAVLPSLNETAATVYETVYVQGGRVEDAAAAAGVSPRTAQRIRQALLAAVGERLGMVG